MARPAGLEPATYGFEVRRSIQLSYGRTDFDDSTPTFRRAPHSPVEAEASTSTPGPGAHESPRSLAAGTEVCYPSPS
jgi:hypothetical protein